MIYAITNRKLVPGGEQNFLHHIEKIAAAGPDGIILREKDLSPEAYGALAQACEKICRDYRVPLILNHFQDVGRCLNIRRIHLSMAVFKALAETSGGLEGWNQVGVSVHSPEEAVYAEEKGAHYLIAGHIFPTDCKGIGAPGPGFSVRNLPEGKDSGVCHRWHGPGSRTSGPGSRSFRNMYDVRAYEK